MHLTGIAVFATKCCADICFLLSPLKTETDLNLVRRDLQNWCCGVVFFSFPQWARWNPDADMKSFSREMRGCLNFRIWCIYLFCLYQIGAPVFSYAIEENREKTIAHFFIYSLYSLCYFENENIHSTILCYDNMLWKQFHVYYLFLTIRSSPWIHFMLWCQMFHFTINNQRWGVSNFVFLQLVIFQVVTSSYKRVMGFDRKKNKNCAIDASSSGQRSFSHGVRKRRNLWR